MAKWSRYNTLVSVAEGGALFFNARTGSLIRLSPARIGQLGGHFTNIPEDFRGFLLQQGFLVGDDIDEIRLIADVHAEARKEDRVFSATIELTEACNFRCLYCYQAHTPQHLDRSASERIVRYL